MTRSDEIRELYAYNRWANGRMLSAAAALEAEVLDRPLVSSFPSIRATLLHMLTAEWGWLQRWKGVSPTGIPESWTDMGIEGLRAAWSAVEVEQGAFVAGLEAEDLDRVVSYRLLSGAELAQPLWQLLHHVVNHATYHRGQLVTLLRQVGATPPSTDMDDFLRERS